MVAKSFSRASFRPGLKWLPLALLGAGVLAQPVAAQAPVRAFDGADSAHAVRTGRVVGRVADEETGAGLVGAQVVVQGLGLGTLTGEDGRFILAAVPAGTHVFSVSMLGYADGSTPVAVRAGQTTVVSIELKSEIIEIQALTVEGERREGSRVALQRERRESALVTDAIGQEQIARSPDGDAAAVASRAPGVSVVGGKYVYVRGLGERYGSATLNGAALASPEPDRKAVPLDMIPASFLESVVTAKTYSPEMPGDYAGGLVQLRTRSSPGSGLFRLSASTGFDTRTSLEPGLGYAGGDLDLLGFDDGTRALPDAVPRDARLRPSELAPADLEQIGEAFGGSWQPRSVDMPVNRSLGLALGDEYLLGRDERPLSFLLSASWANNFDWRGEETERVFSSSLLEEPEVDYRGRTGTESVDLGGMLQVTFEPAPEHELSLNTVFNRTTDDQARTLQGYNLDANTALRNYRLQYVSQSLLSTQLRGRHEIDLADATVEWRADVRGAARYEPNTRETVYLQAPDGRFLFENFIQSGSVFHQDLSELGWGGALDLTLPFDFAGEDAALRVGGTADVRERDVYTRRFRFIDTDLTETRRELSPDELFSPENIGPDGFEVQEATFAGDNYDARQATYAGYGMVDLELLPRLSASFGGRVEWSDQRVDPVSTFDASVARVGAAGLDNVDVLPALNLTWGVTDAMNLRLGASRTLARPQFRELAPFAYADYAGGYLVRGNPILERARVRNLDVRWEWFPTYEATVAVSGFHKSFDDPIEVLVFQQGAEFAKSWVNAGSAENYGAELELSSSLRPLWSALDDFSFNGNLTLVRSSVSIDEPVEMMMPDVGTLAFDLEDDERPLQGQSPYVVNVGLSYTHPTAGTSASMLFNRFGRRIESVGLQPLPDVYEEARNSLDLVVRQPLGDWSLRFAAERLLGSDVEFTQGGDLLRGYELGRVFSLSVSWGGAD